MRVTINDIAKATGYSKTTVSFAFNAPRQISAEAREKIVETATELGYVPDPIARSLSQRNLGTIGLLLPHPIPFALKNPYMVRLISGLGHVCNDEGLSLTMLPPKRGDLLKSVRGAVVDGLVTIGLDPEDEIVQIIRHRHMPFVSIDGTIASDVPSIGVDDRRAADVAMTYLLEQGHRRIGIVMLEESRSPDLEAYSGIGLKRMRGYEDALARFGMSSTDPAVAIFHEPCSVEGGRRAAQLLIEEYPETTGVVSMSDIIAVGIYQGVQSAGLRIPEDLSLVGFDDIQEAALLSPPLTTVHQPAEEKGRRAGELLVRMISGAAVEHPVEFTCRLVRRQSVLTLTAEPGGTAAAGSSEPVAGR